MAENKVADLGGMSLPEVIYFFSENGTSEVDMKNYQNVPFYEKVSERSLFYKLRRVPFIRGIAAYIGLIYSLLKQIWKNKLWLVVIASTLIYIFLSPKSKTVYEAPSGIAAVIPAIFWEKYFFGIAFYTIIIIFIFMARKNHAAEHKVISAYETKQDLSLSNIKMQPKENRRCGTVLVVWYLILIIPFMFTTFGQLIDAITSMLGFSISYEIFLLARKRNGIGNFVYFFGWLGQKLTTKEPDDKILLRARDGLKKLLDSEGYTYTIND